MKVGGWAVVIGGGYSIATERVEDRLDPSLQIQLNSEISVSEISLNHHASLVITSKENTSWKLVNRFIKVQVTLSMFIKRQVSHLSARMYSTLVPVRPREGH